MNTVMEFRVSQKFLDQLRNCLFLKESLQWRLVGWLVSSACATLVNVDVPVTY